MHFYLAVDLTVIFRVVDRDAVVSMRFCLCSRFDPAVFFTCSSLNCKSCQSTTCAHRLHHLSSQRYCYDEGKDEEDDTEE